MGVRLVPSISQLLRETPSAQLLRGDPGSGISGIAFDSRRVNRGDLFVAIPGYKLDGRQFVQQALARGAAAVVSEPPVPNTAEAASIIVPSARSALADLAAAFYGHPSRELTLVGITGTDGKTSVTQLLSTVLEAAGKRTGWLTTVDLKVGPEHRPNDFQHTTPEAVGVQSFLRELVDARVEVALLEVSSHALALERVRGCELDLAIFTNLSPEHLNFHRGMAEYLAAKLRLFTMLQEPGHKPGSRHGVVNADDPRAAQVRAACPSPVLTYGLDNPADVTASELRLSESGASFTLSTSAGQADVSSPLLGRFNVLNWLAAAAAAHALGIGPEIVARAAAAAGPVPGRMERIRQGQPFLVVVDFAHTPQALEMALRTLRAHTPGRILLLFGNAGERDPASRPTMGGLAAELADFFVISMDDPLHEDPASIAEQAADGARQAGAALGRDFTIELDRRRAIQMLLEQAQPGDTVLLAGKGHEPRMLIGDARLPWDDRQVVTELLQSGPAQPCKS